ncbi:casein kinase II subunit beta [Aspergillus clavatus NRRL 1]|uniref:Casein kinase II subunit beta n=1 Tax=Aspergillus clavatus (strain ATCC 1007 / CBS 513.65 / DSM 816 / NCTC 3887 / NRRL 1 / QM 1276 / 107) TaxID=344612 RepID=A1CQB6_ASPCL|nr:casein kinase II beta subunit CKB2 [Aspergillus clavatus NRRL 1]EAW07837.1 casein kinase II beta subunit CKB2 [Aspergillus clavatus NRRL 1]
MPETSTEDQELHVDDRANESTERFLSLCFYGPIPPLPSSAHCSQFTFQFISSRGNEYFCEIDEEYLTDRFNLTGLNTEVPYYQYALDLVTDVFDLDADDDLREQIEKSARHLYGLVHARYIVTTRGLGKMAEKYKNGDFGKCPRVLCEGQHLLPMGLHDIANMSTVRLYCPKCEDIYNPKSSRHSSIDGAYFGSSFHSIFFQVFTNLVPPKSIRRYEPRIYGFRVHASAALARWQDRYREQMRDRLNEAGVEVKYVEDNEVEDDDEESSEGEAQRTETKGEKVLADAASGRMDLGN